MLQSQGEIDESREVAADRREPAECWEVHRRLREYARHRATLDAAELFDLVRAEQFKIYFLCGCVSIYEYMERVLGYGPHAARERMRVARALASLPETTAALARGERTYSAVRELTRVATAETETDWLAATKGLVVHQIERLVAGHEPGDRPEDPTHPDLRPRVVRIELPTEVYALWRQARMVVATERGGEISDADLSRRCAAARSRRGRALTVRRTRSPTSSVPTAGGRRRTAPGARSMSAPRCSSARPATQRSSARWTRPHRSERPPR